MTTKKPETPKLHLWKVTLDLMPPNTDPVEYANKIEFPALFENVTTKGNPIRGLLKLSQLGRDQLIDSNRERYSDTFLENFVNQATTDRFVYQSGIPDHADVTQRYNDIIQDPPSGILLGMIEQTETFFDRPIMHLTDGSTRLSSAVYAVSRLGETFLDGDGKVLSSVFPEDKLKYFKQFTAYILCPADPGFMQDIENAQMRTSIVINTAHGRPFEIEDLYGSLVRIFLAHPELINMKPEMLRPRWIELGIMNGLVRFADDKQLELKNNIYTLKASHLGNIVNDVRTVSTMVRYFNWLRLANISERTVSWRKNLADDDINDSYVIVEVSLTQHIVDQMIEAGYEVKEKPIFSLFVSGISSFITFCHTKHGGAFGLPTKFCKAANLEAAMFLKMFAESDTFNPIQKEKVRKIHHVIPWECFDFQNESKRPADLAMSEVTKLEKLAKDSLYLIDHPVTGDDDQDGEETGDGTPPEKPEENPGKPTEETNKKKKKTEEKGIATPDLNAAHLVVIGQYFSDLDSPPELLIEELNDFAVTKIKGANRAILAGETITKREVLAALYLKILLSLYIGKVENREPLRTGTVKTYRLTLPICTELSVDMTKGNSLFTKVYHLLNSTITNALVTNESYPKWPTDFTDINKEYLQLKAGTKNTSKVNF